MCIDKLKLINEINNINKKLQADPRSYGLHVKMYKWILNYYLQYLPLYCAIINFKYGIFLLFKGFRRRLSFS